MPEIVCDNKKIPPFQVYPVESFRLPEYFESSLKHNENNFNNYNYIMPNSKLYQLNQLTNPSVFSGIDYSSAKKPILSIDRETDFNSLFFQETKVSKFK